MDIAAIPDKVAIVAPLSSPRPWPARSTSATRRAGRPRERLRLPDRPRACPGRSFRIGGYSL